MEMIILFGKKVIGWRQCGASVRKAPLSSVEGFLKKNFFF